MDDILFELKIMSHEPLCSHRNIVHAYGVSFDPAMLEIEEPSLIDLVNPVVVVELADSRFPDLSELFKAASQETFTFDFLAGLISDVADGISILHEYGLVHNDIKPGNILIFSDEAGKLTAKLGDFGAAGIEATNDKPRGWSRSWAAPESLDECPFPLMRDMKFKKPHDIYAFGLITSFIVLLGEHPLPLVNEKMQQGKQHPRWDDTFDDLIYAEVESFWIKQGERFPEHAWTKENFESIHDILEQTLRLYPGDRIDELTRIRRELTGV
jgi:serine/threonine protein kinase